MADDQIQVAFNEKQYAIYTARLDELYDKLENASEDHVIDSIEREANLLQDSIYRIKS